MKKTLLSLAALMAMSAFASQPLRRYVTRTTDDGRTVCVTRYGTDKFSWWEDTEGVHYTFDATSHRLTTLSETAFREALANSRPQDPMTTPTHGPRHSMCASTADGLGAYGVSGEGVVTSIGTPTIPVIMVAFADLDFLPANDKSKIDRFLNEEGYHDEKYAVGSVADYFDLSSKGHFKPRFDVVAKVTLPNGYKYYSAKSGSATDARRSEAIREAVRLAEEQGVDFSKYAASGRTPLISVLHAGPGEQEDFGSDYEDFFWAHFSQTVISAKTTTFDSYLLTNETMRDFDDDGNVTDEYMTGIGTFCHEMGHALGLPDMYDVNHGTNGAGNTPGYWDVMDYQFMYNGYRPMEYSAYERSMMGWLKVKDITPLGNTHDLAPLGKALEGEEEAYRIVNPDNEREYFILENRQKSTFYMDNMLGSGMLVWRIDYDSNLWSGNRVNIDAAHQRVSVVPADGAWQQNGDLNLRDADNKRYTFAGDLFPGYAGVTTFDANLGTFVAGKFEGAVSNIEVRDEDKHVTFTYALPTPVGLHNALPTPAAESLYDLQGRRTDAKARKGLYIKNDKIIINK